MFIILDKNGRLCVPGHGHYFFNRPYAESVLEQYNKDNPDANATIQETKNPIKAKIQEFHYMREEDRKGITDSLLLEDRTEIVSGRTDEVSFCVITQGHVTIVYKEETYNHPKDYPKELIELIRNHEADHHPDVVINENNWYELIIWDKDNNVLYSDDFDINISECSEEEIKDLICDEIFYILND